MPRVKQPAGDRGSLKWIQRAVGEKWATLEEPIIRQTNTLSIEWRSPLADHDYAEYCDGAWLDCLGLERLRPSLVDFWPKRGPQWDALGLTNSGDVLLVEAKAHIAEMFSPATAASFRSRDHIERSLAEVQATLPLRDGHAEWSCTFYQISNRLAHLYFLRSNGVPAWLILVGFTGDREMGGPDHAETWHAATSTAFHALGFPARHALSPWICHVCPDVRMFS
jgi:hypothetical protein